MFGVKGFGSVDKPRGFQYKPRYWNQEKEEWERKKDEYRAKGIEYSDDEYAPGSLIQRQRIRRMRSADQTHRSSSTILIRCVSFCLLLIIAILILKFIS